MTKLTERRPQYLVVIPPFFGVVQLRSLEEAVLSWKHRGSRAAVASLGIEYQKGGTRGREIPGIEGLAISAVLMSSQQLRSHLYIADKAAGALTPGGERNIRYR